MNIRKVLPIIIALVMFALTFVVGTGASFIFIFIVIVALWIALLVMLIVRAKKARYEEQDDGACSENASFDAMMNAIYAEKSEQESNEPDPDAVEKLDRMLRDGLIDKAEYKLMLKKYGLK